MDIFNNSVDGRRKNTISHLRSEVTTLIGITRGDVIRVIETISHITKEIEENSLSDHGLFIAQLHTRLQTVEKSYVKKS